jgi:hypothetical protein
MVSKHQLYSTALVSVAMISILVGIVGAEPFAYIKNNNNDTIYVINAKINTDAPSSSLCSAPALTGDIHVEKDPTGQTIYNYKVMNTGDAPIKGVAVLDNKIIPHVLAPNEGVEFQTLQPLHLST